jgi:hypothetical protein
MLVPIYKASLSRLSHKKNIRNFPSYQALLVWEFFLINSALLQMLLMIFPSICLQRADIVIVTLYFRSVQIVN